MSVFLWRLITLLYCSASTLGRGRECITCRLGHRDGSARRSGEESQAQGFISPICKVVAPRRVDLEFPLQWPVLCCNMRLIIVCAQKVSIFQPAIAISTLRVHLGGRSRVKETKSGPTTEPCGKPLRIGMIPEMPPPTLSEDPLSKAWFKPPHDGVNKTEGLHLHQRKSVIDGIKRPLQNQGRWHQLYSHHTCRSFLEDQQFGVGNHVHDRKLHVKGENTLF